MSFNRQLKSSDPNVEEIIHVSVDVPSSFLSVRAADCFIVCCCVLKAESSGGMFE